MSENNSNGGKKTSNVFELRGNIAQDPVVSELGDGKKAVRLSVATNESYKKEDGTWGQMKPEYTRVNVTQPAQVKQILDAMEREDNPLKKGSQFAVKGALRKSSYEKDGEKRYASELVPTTKKGAVVTEFEQGDYKNINKVELTGFVADEPQIRTTKDGKEFLTMSVATDYGYKDQEGGFKNVTNYTDVTSFQPKAIEAARAKIESGELGKGSLVSVMGRYQERQEGDKRYMNLQMKGGAEKFKVLEESKANREAAAAAKKAKSAGKDEDEMPF
jgi:single-strand DNA-binding protein